MIEDVVIVLVVSLKYLSPSPIKEVENNWATLKVYQICKHEEGSRMYQPKYKDQSKDGVSVVFFLGG